MGEGKRWMAEEARGENEKEAAAGGKERQGWRFWRRRELSIEKYSWEKKNPLVQERIVSLEEENNKVRNAATEREKMEKQQKAAKVISKGKRQQEKNGGDEQIAEAKKLASKLKEDLLGGRKLIEGLQTDNFCWSYELSLRGQRTMLLPGPLTHFSPLRFGESIYAVAANYPLPSAPSRISPLTSPEVTLPSSSSSPKIVQATLSSNLIPSWDPGRPEVDSPIIVRLPPAKIKMKF
ncbi:hypothetical protein MMC31_007274 [Peltigera leucophlebia]|nr:hypothetical protein [Peltigera leucophlebia]